MMILRNSPASPFGRKVRIAIKLLGLDKDVEIRAADTNDPNDDLRQQNALGKIPTLIDENGTAYFDSRVIVEYLDTRAGGGIEAQIAGPWSVKVEYLYVDLGDGDSIAGSRPDFSTNIVRAGLNYRF